MSFEKKLLEAISKATIDGITLFENDVQETIRYNELLENEQLTSDDLFEAALSTEEVENKKQIEESEDKEIEEFLDNLFE